MSVPVGLIDGCTENRAELAFPVIEKATTWPASSAGPATMPVAKLETVRAPESSLTVLDGEIENEGAAFGRLCAASPAP